jgi:hypothetical protein
MGIRFRGLVDAARIAQLDNSSHTKMIIDVANSIFHRLGVSVSGPASGSLTLSPPSTAAVEEETVGSRLRKSYDDKYADEITKNIDLNRFAFNLKTSYRRFNLVRDQLIYVPHASVPSDRRYNIELEGDEELPLGREFQHFIRTFLEYQVEGSVRLGRGRAIVHVMHHEVQSLIRVLGVCSTPAKGLSYQQREDRDLLTVKIMRVLRAMLHNELCQMPKDFAADNPYCISITESVTYIQNVLDFYKIMHSLVPLIASPSSAISTEVSILCMFLLV